MIKILQHNVQHWLCRASEWRLADGWAIACRRGLDCRRIERFKELLVLEVNGTNGKVCIGTIYLPPRREVVPWQEMIDLFNYACPAYLIGDLNMKNYDIGDDSSNTRGVTLKNLIDNNKCKFLGPHFPTYYHSSGKGSTLDIVLGNNRTNNIYTSLGPQTSSDHEVVIARVGSDPIKLPVREQRDIGKVNWNDWREGLGKISMERISEEMTIAEANK
jgi:hypothetical protein